jgi:hypothetical protein
VDSPGSGHGPLAGCCECGDEPLGSDATELVCYKMYHYFGIRYLEQYGENSVPYLSMCSFSNR